MAIILTDISIIIYLTVEKTYAFNKGGNNLLLKLWSYNVHRIYNLFIKKLLGQHMWSSDDIYFMKLAIEESMRAETANEVPIGAVLIMDGKVLSVGHNCSIRENDPTAHAEIVALRSAGEWLQNYRFPNTTMYVTLEPCLMCFGALLQARISRLVFGARDSKINISRNISKLIHINDNFLIEGGLLEDKCREQLQMFFKLKR